MNYAARAFIAALAMILAYLGLWLLLGCRLLIDC